MMLCSSANIQKRMTKLPIMDNSFRGTKIDDMNHPSEQLYDVIFGLTLFAKHFPTSAFFGSCLHLSLWISTVLYIV